MTTFTSSWRLLAASVAGLCVFGVANVAGATAGILGGPSTSGCTPPTVSQPFLAFGDTGDYMLAPGQSADFFTGTGWTLAGGAHVAQMPVMDGVNGTVLDLPSGGIAVSPAVCVESDYPTARTLIATTPDASVGVTTSYPGMLPIIPRVQFSGSISSAQEYWQVSSAFQVHPGDRTGWQLVTFKFTNSGPGDAVIYDFYIDPRMSD